ncbi:MAG: sugar phosphate nucleotidyltransferase [Gammaproteobacteria bacterium]|nr:sugar phosphate nucleotidyltransferase [Gammaproteobacteria bacterium]
MATHPATRDILPVVLAGGAGTRLWPLSHPDRPKQFLRLFGESTLLQQTLLRLQVLRCHAPYIVCNHAHRWIAAEQSGKCGVAAGALVIEPAARNTAPATALAALNATAAGADPVLLVLPADHHIADEAAFETTVERAIEFAESGRIVVFGIQPSHPATAYGYIRAGATANDSGVAAVAAFAEKPPVLVAEQYLAEGGWYWNSGMFLLRASVYLDELGRHRPDILEACAAAAAVERTDAGSHQAGEAFLRCPADSIDRAVMERTRHAVVVPADIGWSDVGTWDSLSERLPWEKTRHHPWGRAETCPNRDGFRLQRLTIPPGQALSVTKRGTGATFWVVVHGLGEVVRGMERLLPAEGESTRLPGGVRHRLTNVGEHALEVIEVQTDGRFAEDGVADLDDPDSAI